MTIHMSPQQEKFSGESRSGYSLYRELAVGNASLAYFFCYEIYTTLFSNLPGAAGFAIRAGLWPLLLGACGRRPAVGRGVVLRNPRRIYAGGKVLIDDYAALDARGNSAAIRLGRQVSVGRYSSLVAKDAVIELADAVNIGSYCRIATQSTVTIGESTLVAAYAYIGAGNHQRGTAEQPMISRPMDIRGGVTIGKHAWIGTRATILDGVNIGDGAIVGAHALVMEDVPAHTIVAGTPARVLKHLNPTNSTDIAPE